MPVAFRFSVLRKFAAEYISCQISLKVQKVLTCCSKIVKEKEIWLWVVESMGAQGQEGVIDFLGGISRSKRAGKMFLGGESAKLWEFSCPGK